MSEYIHTGNITLSLIPESDFDYQGNYEHEGGISLNLFPESEFATTYIHTGAIRLSLYPGSEFQNEFVHIGNIRLPLHPTSIIRLEGQKPYIIKASLSIDGVDYSTSLYGVVSVIVETDSATRFSFSLDTDVSPFNLLNKDIRIGFQASDINGVMSVITSLVRGKIREANYDVDSKGLVLSGYDYGGVHHNNGELYSGEVTNVKDGSIYISAAGTYNLGKSPIWDILASDSEIRDGKDFYADTLNGIIYVPFGSKLAETPSTLTYKYGEYAATYQELIESLATTKGWNMSMENVSIPEYSSLEFQPLIALSNESVIDALKKCLEVGGCKLDSSLYPTLRVYSEVVNSTETPYLEYDETKIFEGTAVITHSLDNIINKQTVRGVSKVDTNVVLGDFEETINKSGTYAHRSYTWHEYGVSRSEAAAYEAALSVKENTPRELIVDITIPATSMYEYNVVHTGGGEAYTYSISQHFTINGVSVKGEAEVTLDEDTGKFHLKIYRSLEIAEIYVEIYTLTWSGFLTYYPQVDWNVVINTKSLTYGDGTSTPLVEVTGTRNIPGISAELVGDLYEHPYIETEDQAKELCKAILYSNGLLSKIGFSLPLHEAAGIKKGKRAIITTKGARIDGIIKSAAYMLDTESAEGTVNITVKGVASNV